MSKWTATPKRWNGVFFNFVLFSMIFYKEPTAWLMIWSVIEQSDEIFVFVMSRRLLMRWVRFVANTLGPHNRDKNHRRHSFYVTFNLVIADEKWLSLNLLTDVSDVIESNLNLHSRFHFFSISFCYFLLLNDPMLFFVFIRWFNLR